MNNITPTPQSQLSDPSAVAPKTISDYLDCLQVVMVNTTLPANIGSAARAMHTMGLSQLTVVNPKLPIDDSSVSCAAGGSFLLDQAKVTPTLKKALANCQLVFAASSRSRHLPRPVVTPSEAAAIMIRFIDQQRDTHSCLAAQKQQEAPSTPVQEPNQTQSLTAQTAWDSQTHQKLSPQASIAILFGREDRGLTNEELAFADFHIQIQANPDYPVLNVAAAVQVIASFIYAKVHHHVTALATHSDSDDPHLAIGNTTTADDAHTLAVMLRQVWDEPAITHAQSQQLTDRLTALMVQLKLANPDDLRALPQRLSRMTSRLQLDQKEYQLISAIIAKLLSH